MQISAVILTHNSEKSIKDCISSVSWCSEIVVIDDNSADKTRETAKSLGANVFTNPLRDDFSAQRNFGLQKAKGPWVLFLDSDETVPDELKTEILGRLRDDRQISGYQIRREDYVMGKKIRYGDAGSKYFVRLARKDGSVWKNPVHEKWDIKGTMERLENPLIHNAHASIGQFLDKINYYSTIRAADLYQHNVKIYPWQILFYPLAKFMHAYIVLGGFRDGTIGMVHALMMSFHSFLTRAKLWSLWYRQSAKK